MEMEQLMMSVLQVPAFPDRRQAQAALLVRNALIALFIGAIVFLVANAVNIIQEDRGTGLAVIALICIVVLYYVLRQGNLFLTSVAICGILWLVPTLGALQAGGIQATILAGFPLCVAVACFTLGIRYGIVATVISVLTISIIYLLEQAGHLQTPHYESSMALLIHTAYLLIGLAVYAVSQRSMEQNLYDVLQKERALLEKARKLESTEMERGTLKDSLRDMVQQNRQLSISSPAPLWTLFDSVVVPMVATRLTDDQIIKANPAFCELTGYQGNDLLGQRLHDLHLWDQRQQSLQPHLLNRSVRKGVEMQWKTHGGEQRDVVVSAQILDLEGERCLILTAVDVSERRQVEAQRETVELSVVRINQERELIDAKERFIQQVSHEFRTPLTVIRTAEELLRSYYDRLNDDKREQYFDRIEQQVERMTGLLDNLLQIGKGRNGKLEFQPTLVDIYPFCVDLLDQVQMSDRGMHRFVFKVSGQMDKAYMDARLLQQILFNVLGNAVKYSPEHSEIRFEMHRQGDSIRFQVTDRGMGIPQSDQPYIFQPFYRTSISEMTTGTGLGLALARESVLAHGGTIRFQSEEGRGTSFTVDLPARFSMMAHNQPAVER
jgi:PAS domain S-box-containing protein